MFILTLSLTYREPYPSPLEKFAKILIRCLKMKHQYIEHCIWSKCWVWLRIIVWQKRMRWRLGYMRDWEVGWTQTDTHVASLLLVNTKLECNQYFIILYLDIYFLIGVFKKDRLYPGISWSKQTHIENCSTSLLQSTAKTRLLKL